MNALTIRQPWAWMIAEGHKRVEWRTWYTDFRGQFAIHAGAAKPAKADLQWIELSTKIIVPSNVARGVMVATATLVDCVEYDDLYNELSDTDKRLVGDQECRLYGFILRDVTKIETPVREIGRLGFWDWNGVASLKL